jgi:hypothetical protein
MRKLTGLVALSLLAALPAVAHGQVTVGEDGTANAFPFGGTFTNLHPTVYQEIYNATAFSGPINIASIDFFRELGVPLNTMTFTLSFSTTTLGLNVDSPGNISSTNYNGNDGANNTLFGTFSITGDAPDVLTFSGTPFLYTPATGNLLLDLRIVSFTGSGDSFFEDNGFSGNGEISRVTDFGTSNTGFGLVTEFDPAAVSTPPSTVPEPSSIGLLATGLAGLTAFRRRQRR